MAVEIENIYGSYKEERNKESKRLRLGVISSTGVRKNEKLY
jgi:hypothetical protein